MCETFAGAIINSLTAHIAVLDSAGTIVAVNHAWERFAEVNNGLIAARTGVGENYLAVCRRAIGRDTEGALTAAEGIEAVLRGELPHFSLEYPCFGPTKRAWFVLTVTPLTGEQGGAVVSHMDITDRKLTEELLQQSETRYRALLEAIPDAIARIQRDGRFLDIHIPKGFTAILPADQLIDRNVQSLLPPALAEVIMMHNERALIHQQSEIFEYAIPIGESQYWRELRMVPIDKNEVLVIVRDIHERRQAEVALHESEERYRTLVEMSPDAIVVYQQNRITYANPSCLRLLAAASPDEVIGKSPLDFIYPSEHVQAQARMTQLLEQGGSSSKIESRFVRLDGVTIDVEMLSARLQMQDQTAIQTVWRDITARKQAEVEKSHLLEALSEQRTQLRALNRRLAEVQETERKALSRELHDQVGQNISLLAINLKMLQNQFSANLSADDAAHKRFKDSQSLLQQLNERMRNLMAELWPPVLDDYGLLAALEWYATRLAAHSQLTIEVHGTEPTPRLPANIEQTLFRIAQEALTNVVKHAEATQATLRLTSTPEFLWLTIVDNGRGFDPHRLKGTTQLQSWGVLNMHERAEAIGGQIDILSQAGKGTTIEVEVPLVETVSV